MATIALLTSSRTADVKWERQRLAVPQLVLTIGTVVAALFIASKVLGGDDGDDDDGGCVCRCVPAPRITTAALLLWFSLFRH